FDADLPTTWCARFIHSTTTKTVPPGATRRASAPRVTCVRPLTAAAGGTIDTDAARDTRRGVIRTDAFPSAATVVSWEKSASPVSDHSAGTAADAAVTASSNPALNAAGWAPLNTSRTVSAAGFADPSNLNKPKCSSGFVSVTDRSGTAFGTMSSSTHTPASGEPVAFVAHETTEKKCSCAASCADVVSGPPPHPDPTVVVGYPASPIHTGVVPAVRCARRIRSYVTPPSPLKSWMSQKSGCRCPSPFASTRNRDGGSGPATEIVTGMSRRNPCRNGIITL